MALATPAMTLPMTEVPTGVEPLKSVKVTFPSLTVPAGLVTVAPRVTFCAAALKVAEAAEAVVVVMAWAPIVKVPSTGSVALLVGAGDRVSCVKLASLPKIAVAVVEMFCNKLTTDVPFASPEFTVNDRSNRSAVVLKGIVPVPCSDEPWTMISPAAGNVTNGAPSAANVEPDLGVGG